MEKSKRKKYYTICKGEVINLYGKVKFNEKFYTLCSKKCYHNYVQNIWRKG